MKKKKIINKCRIVNKKWIQRITIKILKANKTQLISIMNQNHKDHLNSKRSNKKMNRISIKVDQKHHKLIKANKKQIINHHIIKQVLQNMIIRKKQIQKIRQIKMDLQQLIKVVFLLMKRIVDPKLQQIIKINKINNINKHHLMKMKVKTRKYRINNNKI